MALWFARFCEAFRFIARYRARKAEDARLEREHQLALVAQLASALEVIISGSAKQAEENTKAITALAASSAAQAEAFSTWISSFQIAAPPTSSVVRDSDELEAEEQRQLESLPEEFRLAYELHTDDGSKAFIDDVRKDMRP